MSILLCETGNPVPDQLIRGYTKKKNKCDKVTAYFILFFRLSSFPARKDLRTVSLLRELLCKDLETKMHELGELT